MPHCWHAPQLKAGASAGGAAALSRLAAQMEAASLSGAPLLHVSAVVVLVVGVAALVGLGAGAVSKHLHAAATPPSVTMV